MYRTTVGVNDGGDKDAILEEDEEDNPDGSFNDHEKFHENVDFGSYRALTKRCRGKFLMDLTRNTYL